MLDGWKGVAVIVAGLALLGFLVFMKVDGAAVAAIAGVTTLLAWLTKSPRDGEPPPGAKLVPFAAIGLAAYAGLLSCAKVDAAVCDPKSYSAELAACSVSAETLEESIACENVFRARCGRPQRVMPADAGAEGGDR